MFNSKRWLEFLAICLLEKSSICRKNDNKYRKMLNRLYK